MPHLILENKNLILFLNLKFNFMKRRGLIFNSRPNKTAVFALGLMLGLCPVSKAWADTNMKDSQVVAQAQKKVKGQVVDATGEPLIGVNITVIGGTEGTITDIDGNYTIGVPAGAKLKFSYIGYKNQEAKITQTDKKLNIKIPSFLSFFVNVHSYFSQAQLSKPANFLLYYTIYKMLWQVFSSTLYPSFKICLESTF